MSSVQLLDKTRKIIKLLHNNNSQRLSFNDLCNVMSDILESNVLIVSYRGKILGIGDNSGVEEITDFFQHEVGTSVDGAFNERLLNVLSTKENVNLETMGFSEEVSTRHQAVVVPVDASGERLGTMFIYKMNSSYDIDDIILAEYGATVAALEMERALNEENTEENRKEQIVKAAVNTLSLSELEAIVWIFDGLNGKEGLLVASRIADEVGITRSVIVNALRKFESAGIIESRSSGMKGTYIRVLNDVIYDELDDIRDKVKNKEK